MKNDCIKSWWIYSKNQEFVTPLKFQNTAINLAALKGSKTRANTNSEYFMHEPETWKSEMKHEAWKEHPQPECTHATAQWRAKPWTCDPYMHRNCFCATLSSSVGLLYRIGIELKLIQWWSFRFDVGRANTILSFAFSKRKTGLKNNLKKVDFEKGIFKLPNLLIDLISIIKNSV